MSPETTGFVRGLFGKTVGVSHLFGDGQLERQGVGEVVEVVVADHEAVGRAWYSGCRLVTLTDISSSYWNPNPLRKQRELGVSEGWSREA